MFDWDDAGALVVVEDQAIERYARVLVEVGLRPQSGDRLLIRSGAHAGRLVPMVVSHAYRAGVVNVDVLWSDPELDRARFIDGPEDALNEVPYAPEVLNRAARRGDSVLTLVGGPSTSMEDADPVVVEAFNKRLRTATSEFFGGMFALDYIWSVAAVPSVEWARLVFPDRSDEDALAGLWEAVLAACRATGEDPVGDWEKHLDELDARQNYLNQKRYTSIRYQGPGTDMTVGLSPNHWWNHPGEGNKGRRTVANIPTEEVSTSPDSRRADGVVTATKPLIHAGTVIKDFQLRFVKGEVVEATAQQGQDALDRLLATDQGSRRLGEVALVPQSSAVAAQNIIWHQTLFDENDASHLALGAGYPFGLKDGLEMTPEELQESGLNQSSQHIDFVVGSSDTTISGVKGIGSTEVLIEEGEWTFTI